MPGKPGVVTNTQRPLMSVILEADPDFYAKRKNELLYEFSNGRQFRGDPNKVATAYPDE